MATPSGRDQIPALAEAAWKHRHDGDGTCLLCLVVYKYQYSICLLNLMKITSPLRVSLLRVVNIFLPRVSSTRTRARGSYEELLPVA
mmetsp:Transcript_10912/g.22250  ORF Transcript_10912/g.22250 Transcript_10912/m.22250 type:complete len:87 (-) Transcript_10912:331-591(-)